MPYSSELTLLDSQDPLAGYREQFCLPDNAIYLCSHSLGAQPKRAAYFINRITQQWNRNAVCAWNSADWINLPQQFGQQLAGLLGAASDEVIVTDSTSINLFKLLLAGLQLRPGRNVILTEQDNFPADLYIAQAVAALQPDVQISYCQRDEISQHLNESTALVLLTHINYRSSAMYDMAAITQLAHAHGALMVWDLAHSAGIVPLDLNACEVDLAVGCTYKYLNSGPGAPGFLYAAKRHHDHIHSPLAGWMGHAAPFSFAKQYQPAEGVRRFLCGTPPIIAMAAIAASLELFAPLDLQTMRQKSQRLSELFIKLMKQQCPTMQLISPTANEARGGHVGFKHPDAYAIKQALQAHGVIADFRAPTLIRFSFAPFYTRFRDIADSVTAIAAIIDKELYRRAEFTKPMVVT